MEIGFFKNMQKGRNSGVFVPHRRHCFGMWHKGWHIAESRTAGGLQLTKCHYVYLFNSKDKGGVIGRRAGYIVEMGLFKGGYIGNA